MLAEARRLADAFGWSTLPVIAKKPALRTWKEFQRQRPSGDELTCMFVDDRITGIAVVCGPVSDSLVVRDFDRTDAYQQWADDHRALAKMLPTSRTARGYHIYCRSPGASGIQHFPDGELRAGGYVLCPPSRHSKGTVYRWIRQPFGEIPLLSAVELSSLGNANTVTPITHCMCPTIDEAITATLPTGPGQRNRRIFDFARHVRALLGPAAIECDLLPIVQDWHGQALPFIRTKQFAETWADFRTAWPRIKRVPIRLDAVRQEITADDPAERLRELCQRLQAQWGERPFFLAARLAGQIIGTDHMTANRLMRNMEGTGELRRVSTGTLANRQASQWHYANRKTPRPITHCMCNTATNRTITDDRMVPSLRSVANPPGGNRRGFEHSLF